MPGRPAQVVPREQEVTRGMPGPLGLKDRPVLAARLGQQVPLDQQDLRAPQAKREKPVSRGHKGLLDCAGRPDRLVLRDLLG
jgi:hypothetical protein